MYIMKVHILGSLSGTEPFPNRHHTAWVLELDNGHLYWFDAGENCSHTAYLKGLDFFNIKALFISHPHSDHLEGLLNIFHIYRKMQYLENDLATSRTIQMFFPVENLWNIYRDLLYATGGCPPNLQLPDHLLSDGGCFENDEIKVEFLANTHIPVAPGEKLKSFSFRITAQDKVIVYSGDVGSAAEISDWSRQCDLILMESGHHHPWEVCAQWHADNCQINQIVFMHHGRDVLYWPTECKIRCRRAWGKEVIFAEDGMSFEL